MAKTQKELDREQAQMTANHMRGALKFLNESKEDHFPIIESSLNSMLSNRESAGHNVSEARVEVAAIKERYAVAVKGGDAKGAQQAFDELGELIGQLRGEWNM